MSRRGRPRLLRPAIDLGTEQLRAKRMHGATLEPLDSLLSRGLLTELQHKTGLYFRWVYTIKYGAPTIQSSFWKTPYISNMKILEERHVIEARYMEMIEVLRKLKALEPVYNLVIHHQYDHKKYSLEQIRIGLNALSAKRRTLFKQAI